MPKAHRRQAPALLLSAVLAAGALPAGAQQSSYSRDYWRSREREAEAAAAAEAERQRYRNRFGGIEIENLCSHDLRVVVEYVPRTDGVGAVVEMRVPADKPVQARNFLEALAVAALAGRVEPLRDGNGPVQHNNSYAIGFYAETLPGDGSAGLVWEGERMVEYQGARLPMRQEQEDVGQRYGNTRLSFNCPRR
ncbi:MAG: hypothetical protein AB7O57_01190 [Hyphomicrobiaceae bacterium]